MTPAFDATIRDSADALDGQFMSIETWISTCPSVCPKRGLQS